MTLCVKCLLLPGAHICNSLSKKRYDIVSLGVPQYFRQKDWIFKRSVSFFHLASEAYVLDSRSLNCVRIPIRSFSPFVSSSILSPKPAPLPRHS